MYFDVVAIRIYTKYLVATVRQINIHKTVCGVQDIHKFYYVAYFLSQCPRSEGLA